MASEERARDRAVLAKLVTGYQLSQVLYATVKLELIDNLAQHPLACDELAAATKTHPGALRRLLRALLALGIVEELPDGRYAITSRAAPLQTDATDSLVPYVLMYGGEHYRAWGALVQALETGRSGFEHIAGQRYYGHLSEAAASEAAFSDSMTAGSRGVAASLLAAFDFCGFETIVDVGGGQGALLGAILGACPDLRGILFDRQPVIDRARSLLAERGLATRCQAVAGDFFEEVPPGGDGYLLRNVLHDWEDEACLQILAACRRGMKPGACLLVVQRLLPERLDAVSPGAVEMTLTDLMLLVVKGGGDRTEGEYRQLLAKADFRVESVVHAGGGRAVIQALPAG